MHIRQIRHIRSTDSSVSRSIEDHDEPAPTPSSPLRNASVERALPDWDRVPTLDVATMTGIQSRADDPKALAPKIEKLTRDLKVLHDALAPYARECKEVLHGLHEIEDALHIIKEAKHCGMLAPAVVGAAIAKAMHGIHAAEHGFAGMRREAPEAVRRAQPALAKVVEDIADIKATVMPALDRSVTIRG